MLEQAATLVGERGIRTDRELEALLLAADADQLASPAVLTRLRHMFDAGGWVILESEIADLPADLRWLFETEAVSLDQLSQLHASTRATAVTDLADLVRRGQLHRLPGFTADVERAIAAAIPQLRATRRRIPLGRAVTLTEALLDQLRARPSVMWAETAGSVRRGQDTVGDIELVVATPHADDAVRTVLDSVDVARILHQSSRRLYVMTDGTQIGIRCPEPAQAGAVLLQLTGSFSHLDQLHARAARRGWSLGPGGLDRGDGQPAIAETEQAIYAALDLQWVPPEIRDGEQELRYAESGTLPTLIDRSAIRGDLHMHTFYSDGRDSIEAMVTACVALGYEYMAITDHSPSSSASRNLSLEAIEQQVDEIAALRERFPQIAILHGCEVDILPDERLDFPDRVLERFDIVLASLHDRAGQGPESLLRRYFAAMRHPLVSIITHPTNRLVPSRAGYDLDYERLFATAVETGTMVEIDGGPSHLDLDGVLARQAVAAGAMLVVDSDSHRADALARQMELGVKTARRGWVEARHVMNTRRLSDLRTLIAGKRAR